MTGWKVLMLNLLQKDAWLHEKKHSLYFGVQTAVHIHGNVKEKNTNDWQFGVVKSAVALIVDIRGTLMKKPHLTAEL